MTKPTVQPTGQHRFRFIPRSLTLLLAIAGLSACQSAPPPDASIATPSPSPSPTVTPSSTPSPNPTVTSSPAPEPESTPAPTAIASQDTWSRLQNPDTHYFVLMRHAIAPGTGDPANFQVDDCTTQRNLDETGRAQAERTGAAFRDRGVTVAQVLSSEWCRCLETAELLNLGEVERFPVLNSFFRDRSTAESQTADLADFMRTHPGEPGVTVLVTHFVNIAAIAGGGVSSGAMVVMQVDAVDELVVVERLEEF